MSWFRRPSPVPRALANGLVAAARAPWLYAGLGVPDTATGRFEVLCAHFHLVLKRMGRDPALAEVMQAMVDVVFKDLDHGLREVGVGDLSVPRKMHRLAGHVYGRVAQYDAPGPADGEDALAALVAEVVFGGGPGDAAGFARYLRHSAACLDALASERILAGQLAFAQAPGTAAAMGAASGLASP